MTAGKARFTTAERRAIGESPAVEALPGRRRPVVPVASRLDARARRLVLSSPADGSQDLYVSTMVGLPQRLVPAVREVLAGPGREPGVPCRKGGCDGW